jgi:hypothetical protein
VHVLIALSITRLLMFVSGPIDLDDELGGGAVEVGHERSDRMLTPDLQRSSPLPQHAPKQLLA